MSGCTGRGGDPDLDRTGPAQRRRHRGDGRAGGGHVIDYEHAAWCSRHGAHAQPPTALRAGPSRLRRARAAVHEAPAGSSETTGHRQGQQLGLVEAACTAAGLRGGGPGDDVDTGGVDEAREPVGQPRQRTPRVAVLEPGDELTPHALVGEQGDPLVDPRGRWSGGRRPQTGPTARAGRLAAGTAARAGGRQQHAADPTDPLRQEPGPAIGAIPPEPDPEGVQALEAQSRTPALPEGRAGVDAGTGGLSTGSGRACTGPPPGCRGRRPARAAAR